MAEQTDDLMVTVRASDLRAVLQAADYVTNRSLVGPVDRMGDALALATMRRDAEREGQTVDVKQCGFCSQTGHTTDECPVAREHYCMSADGGCGHPWGYHVEDRGCTMPVDRHGLPITRNEQAVGSCGCQRKKEEA